MKKLIVTISIDSAKRRYVITSNITGYSTYLYWDSAPLYDDVEVPGFHSYADVEAYLEAENIPYKWAPYHA